MSSATLSDPPLRVAVVAACPYPVPQGSQVYLRESARAVHQAGADVRLVVYGYGIGEADEPFPLHRGPNPLGATKTAAGPSWHKPFLDAALVRTLRRVLRRDAIDVVDAHNYEGLLVALASRFRPIVYHPHNAMADELPHYTRFTAAARRFGTFLDRGLPRRADAVAAPHDRLAEYLTECGCDPARIHVVPPPMPARSLPVKREFTQNPAIVYAGNLDAYQNLNAMDDVARAVRANQPAAEFIVATAVDRGVPWGQSRRVTNAGELDSLLAGDVIVVCPRTSWSGYPIKLLNAMNAAAPIVCAAGAAHALTHNENGIVVPDNDAGAMAQAILLLMRDPEKRHRLGASARATLERDHDPQAIGGRLVDLYRDVSRDKIARS